VLDLSKAGCLTDECPLGGDGEAREGGDDARGPLGMRPSSALTDDVWPGEWSGPLPERGIPPAEKVAMAMDVGRASLSDE
jgi:hypothetical protein